MASNRQAYCWPRGARPDPKIKSSPRVSAERSAPGKRAAVRSCVGTPESYSAEAGYCGMAGGGTDRKFGGGSKSVAGIGAVLIDSVTVVTVNIRTVPPGAAGWPD